MAGAAGILNERSMSFVTMNCMKSTGYSKNRERGFTLLEVTIAVLILAIGAVMLMRSQADSIRLYTESDMVFRSTLLAQHLMTELESAAALSTGTRKGKFESPDEGYSFAENVADTGIPGVYLIAVSIYRENREIITLYEYMQKKTLLE